MVLDKTGKTVVTVLALGALIQLFAAIVHGARGEWFRFGLTLTGCVISTFFFVSVLLACKIESRFNQLEKLIKGKQQSEKVTEQNTDKSANP